MPYLEHQTQIFTTSNKSDALINIMLAVEPQPDQHQLLKKRTNN